MLNLDDITNENNRKQNKKWLFIPDHPYIILIIDGSGSGKRKASLNLINEQDDIDKIFCTQRIWVKPSTNVWSKSTKVLE